MLTKTNADLMATAKPYHIYPGKTYCSIYEFVRSNAYHCSSGFAFVAYPNRDSTGYKERYNIPEAQTVIRYKSTSVLIGLTQHFSNFRLEAP